jgi:hypothetical protein
VHEPPITTNMLRLPILFILLAATAINLTKDKSWLKQQLAKFAFLMMTFSKLGQILLVVVLTMICPL